MSNTQHESGQFSGDGKESEETSTQKHRGTNSRGNTKKRKRSVVWDHFVIIEGGNGEKSAQCNHCGKKLASRHGTTSLSKHLKFTCDKVRIEVGGGEGSSPRVKFDQVRSRRDLALAVIKHHYPFNIGEHAYMEAFLYGLNSNFKLPCRNTIRRDVIDVYEKEKLVVYEMLDNVNSKVSLTIDIWSSPHSHAAYGCVTVHFIDDNWKLQHKVISFKKILYRDDGDALFECLQSIIVDWNLNKKLLSVVVDNSTTNDAMIDHLIEWLLNSSAKPVFSTLLHVRCSANILNLIVQDGLSKIKRLIENIRATVRYINKSILAYQRFEQAKQQFGLASEREIAMDVPNRWNSTYELLETALSLRATFSRLELLDKDYKFNPSESEWEEAKLVLKSLKIFYKATHHFSGRDYPTSNVFFADMCEIHLKLIEWKTSRHDLIREMSMLMYEKFDKYWTECSLVLAVAVVFDPRFKMHLVEYYYSRLYGQHAREFIMRVQDSLEDLFDAYGGNASPYSAEVEPINPNPEESDSYLDFDNWCTRARAPLVSRKTELEMYLEEDRFPRTGTFDILNWWKLNSPRLPILAKIARDVLAVPVTTVKSDAAFSVGGRVIDESRSCLLPDAVEALVVTDEWLPLVPEKRIEGNVTIEEAQVANSTI